MGIRKEVLMPFIKFVQCHLKLIIHDEKRKIEGVFKYSKTGEIDKGDNFQAIVVGNREAETTYKAYLKWNNYIKYDYENNREYVSAKWGIKK